MKLDYINRLATALGLFICLTTVYIFSSGLMTGKAEQVNGELRAPIEIAAISKIVQEEMALQEIVGCAVGVVRNGQIIHVMGYGYLDLAQTKPVTENTVFRWASISKTLTAVAAFKAIEEGKLELDDKVKAKYSNWNFTDNRGDITVRHLLNNRSGILHYGEGLNDKLICSFKSSINYTSESSFNANQSVNLFKDCRLAFKPDSTYLYSTAGFNLLGATIGAATGTNYETYVKTKIGSNLSSLTSTSSDPGGFTKDCNNKLKEANEGKVMYKLPGGGWASNIQDLTKFMQGLINGTYLGTTSALWKSVSNNSGYAFGTYTDTRFGRTHVNHGGDQDNVCTYLSFFPADKTGVCVMINGRIKNNKGSGAVSRTRLTRKIEKSLAKGYDWEESDLPMESCGSDKDCGEPMMGVWRKTGTGNVVMRRGYTNSSFFKEWEELRKLGYYCSDVETYLDVTVRKWDGVFKKGISATRILSDLKTNDFNAKAIEFSNNGYRLIDIEPYLDGLVRKWAGVFIKVTGPYQFNLELTSDEFGAKHEQMTKSGYQLKDVETYMAGANRKWAAVWLGSGGYLVNRNVETTAFRDLRRDRNAAGWKLVDAESYMDGTVRKWAGVWEKTSVDEKFLYGYKFCEWLNYHQSYKTEGYELIDFSKF